MTETELERMVVRIIGDASLYERMLARAEMVTGKTAKAITKLGVMIEKFGASVMKTGRNLSLALTLPIGLFAKKSVEEFRKFDLAMTETFAKMGRVVPKVRKDMEELAKSMSSSGQTVFSPTELAMGYEALASAGLDAARSMKALPAMARFAQAGAFDLNLAVKLIVGSMASFGELSKDPVEFSKNLEHFSDVIVGVANETTTGVEQVARAMSADAAVAAKGYGMSLEELGAILGVFALQNKDAEEAGNLTGRAIRLMTATFIKNKAVWESMGINLIDKATGKWVKFADGISMLEKAFKNLTGPQRVATLLNMGFETLTLKAILPLVGMSDELNRQAELYKEVGTTAEMAGIQAESFSAQIKKVWNNIAVLDIEIGEILAPLLLKIGDYIIALVDYWRTLSLETKQNILIVTGLVAATGPLILILGSLIWATGRVIATFGMFRYMVMGLAGGIAHLVTGTVGLYRAILMLIAPVGAVAANMSTWMLALTAMGPALAVVVGWLTYTIVRPFGDWLFGVTEFNNALKETIRLQKEVDQQVMARQNAEIAGIMGIEDPAQRFAAMKNAVEMAKKNVKGLEASVRGAQANIDNMPGLFHKWLWGNKDLELAQVELKAVQGQADQARNHLQQLQQAFQGMKPGVVPPGMPLNDAIPLPTELDEETAKLVGRLQEQIDFFGQSKDMIDLNKLALLGLDAATYEHIALLIQENELIEAQADLRKEIDGINASLQEQIETFGMTASQVEIYKLAMKGASYEDIVHTAALYDQLDGMKAFQAQVDKATSLTEKYMSPQEKLIQTQDELFDLFSAGLISVETYNAALADAQGLAQGNYNVNAHFSVSGIDAVAAGSAEALARIREYEMNMSMKPTGGAWGGQLGQFNPGQKQPQPLPVKPIVQGKGAGDDAAVVGLLRQLVLLAQNEGRRPLVTLNPANLEG